MKTGILKLVFDIGIIFCVAIIKGGPGEMIPQQPPFVAIFEFEI